MNAAETKIKELVTFAQNKDGDDRNALFRSLIDLFLKGSSPIRQPLRRQLLEVVEALIPHVEAEDRRLAAERLAEAPIEQMDLAFIIARDRISVSRPLLERAPFDEDQMNALIYTTGRDHHQLISKRSDLSANNWIALARAAPANPPSNRSPLGLWRENLGSNPTRKSAPAQQNIPAEDGFQSHSNKFKAHSGDTTAPQKESTEPQATRQTARLRILRTDEDLLAEHRADHDPHHFTKEVRYNNGAAPLFEAKPAGAPKLVTDHEIANQTAATEKQWERNPTSAFPSDRHASNRTELAGNLNPADRSQASKPLQSNPAGSIDAGRFAGAEAPDFTANISAPANASTLAPLAPHNEPNNQMNNQSGSWSWRSDRDGFIINLSPEASEVFGRPLVHLRGEAILDLLGLNNKLGHPIARALQRRSPIHDAPLYLAQLEKDHRYWTMQAIPIFDHHTGIFNGYEGLLSPVQTNEDRSNNAASLHDDLFLPEGDQPSSMSEIDRQGLSTANLSQPAPSPFDEPLLHKMVSEQTAALVRSTLEQVYAKQPDSLKTPDALEDSMLPASASFIKTESPKPENSDFASKEAYQAPITPQPNPFAANSAKDPRLPSAEANRLTPQNDPASSHDADPTKAHYIAESMDILSQTIARLIDDSKQSGAVSLRLQAEIASACLRVLNEQIGTKK